MNDESLSIDDSALAAYLAGELSPAEVEGVERALAQDPRLATTLEESRRIWRLVPGHPHWDIEKLWQAFAVHSGTGRVSRTNRSLGRTVGVVGWGARRWVWYAAACAAVVVLVLAGTLEPRLGRGRRTAVPMLAYGTGNGERATITLPDGNTVSLSVASRLEVPADYLGGDHTLRLSGAALFAVAHRAGVPFSVVAGGATARVLGTAFMVRHYATDTTTTVAVQQGKVGVRSAVLAAGQQVVVGRGGALWMGAVSPGAFSFASGVLTVEDMPLPRAIPELDRWYDADIRLGDSALVTQRMQGKFAAGSLSDLKGILELTFNVRVVREGRVLTLFPR